MRAPLSGTLCKDGRWKVVVTLTLPDGKKKKQPIYAETQREVQAAARELVHDRGRNIKIPHTMKELYEECQVSRWGKLDGDTKIQYDRYGQLAVNRFSALKDIRDLTMPPISGWVAEMAAAGDSKRHIQLARGVLRIMLKHAAELGWREPVPIWEVRLPKSHKKVIVRRRLSYLEAKTTIEQEPNQERSLYFWLLMESGLRPIEAVSMTKERLLYSQDSWWVISAESKTEAGEDRAIMVSDRLGGAIFDVPNEEIFPNLHFETGAHRKTMSKFWKNALHRAGVPHTNLYQLRKLRVTLWKSAGVPDEVIQKMVGHTDIRLTNQVYDNVTKDRIKRALEGQF